MDTNLLIPSPAFRQMAPKTCAEKQRAYRERKREQGVVKRTKKTRSEFSEPTGKESGKRMKKNFFDKKETEKGRLTFPYLSVLSENEQAKQRKLNRENAKRFREKRKIYHLKTTPESAGKPTEMIVKLDFKGGKRPSSRKRISRGVAKAHKKIKKFQEENTKLQQKNWKLQKKMQRGSESRKTARKVEASEKERSPKTPHSKPNASIQRAGMSPRAVLHVIRKQLIFAHAVSDEVRQAVEKGPQNSNTQHGPSASVSGAGILKKYRCLHL